MNAWQRQLRILSDRRLDDTATEMTAVERAILAVEMTRRALLDDVITTTEGQAILEQQAAVLAACEASLDNNVREQPDLDAFIRELGGLPAHAIARVPTAHTPPLDVFSDADLRRSHPELGNVTVGELVRSSDYGEAA